jgi:hypothetical protein
LRNRWNVSSPTNTGWKKKRDRTLN